MNYDTIKAYVMVECIQRYTIGPKITRVRVFVSELITIHGGDAKFGIQIESD